LWVDYFNRQADVFGVMLARDITFAGSQALYNRFAKVEQTENTCTIDFTEVDAKQAIGLRNEFYISFRNGTKLGELVGGRIEVYETRKDFTTYKVTRTGSGNITFTLL